MLSSFKVAVVVVVVVVVVVAVVVPSSRFWVFLVTYRAVARSKHVLA